MSKRSSKNSRSRTKTSNNHSSIENTFLNETSFISEVDMDIRNEIEKKFKKSSVNSKYVFPRVTKPKKKSPVHPNSRPKLQMEKSLPFMHKLAKSTYEAPHLPSNNATIKKIHRATSSIKSVREKKPKKQSHSRIKSKPDRSKSPYCRSKNPSIEILSKHKRTSSKRGYYDGGAPRPKSTLKKPSHLYTASMESVVPSAIIKTVSYF